MQGTTPGPVRLSDRRGDRPGGQLLRRGVRRERPDPGLLARGEVAPPVGRPRLRAGRVPQAPGAGDRRQGPDLRRRQLQPPHPGLRHRRASCSNVWGTRGTAPGQMSYPYDLAIGPDRSLYVCEYGNHRVQKFTLDGDAAGRLGRVGPRARASCTTPGPWPSTAGGRSRSSTRTTIASSGSGSEPVTGRRGRRSDDAREPVDHGREPLVAGPAAADPPAPDPRQLPEPRRPGDGPPGAGDRCSGRRSSR